MQSFEPSKITQAINKAFSASKEGSYNYALALTQRVLDSISEKIKQKRFKLLQLMKSGYCRGCVTTIKVYCICKRVYFI